jgi:hypothetical protein
MDGAHASQVQEYPQGSLGHQPQSHQAPAATQAAPQPQQDGHQRPARYQTGNRGQRNAPQYKLQAKITGLERTGRKDPILRFDVHVSPESPKRVKYC